MRAATLALLLACCGDPHVLSGFRSPMGVNDKVRNKPHSGVDFKGEEGDAVIAAVGGEVELVDSSSIAGTCVLLRHRCATCSLSTFFTSYCHLQSTTVRRGQVVIRGEQIARLGRTGTGSVGIPHVHFSMCTTRCLFGSKDGDFDGILDPMTFDVGCFEAGQEYWMRSMPVLTHPTICQGR